MNKEFIPYEQALELKELGFNEECFGFYTLDGVYLPNSTMLNSVTYGCVSPLYQQAFRWFRENYGLYGFTYPSIIHNKTGKLLFTNNIDEPEGWDYDTHPEAELACLNKLIELAKNK